MSFGLFLSFFDRPSTSCPSLSLSLSCTGSLGSERKRQLMGSLGNGNRMEKAMWFHPKLMGFNPPERWGHSACYSHGAVYVFGGCCGGLHFSDVLVLHLDKMAWSALATTGKGPGPRDSHSAVLVGRQMIVFGGTNGFKKVNYIHILDLETKEWISPECKGTPPSPRESHSATFIGDDKMVIFGGSGEGDANYLNDLHVLDLKTMRWCSPELKGDVPVPRDSHSAVALGNKLFVYGGDCGHRYYGDVDVLDIVTLTWTKLHVRGSSPGVRAGHASVVIGMKVYVIGGVGDKHYFSDIWILDPRCCSWTQLDMCGQQPQGRFSHSAVVTESEIIVYGGCSEDEHPLNELLVFQLGSERHNSNSISLSKNFRNHSIVGKGRFPRGTENNLKTMCLGSDETVRNPVHNLELQTKQPFWFSSDALHPKRKRTINSKVWEVQSEQEEHSPSLSQHSSPSQSDLEQTPVRDKTGSVAVFGGVNLFKQINQMPQNFQVNEVASKHKGPAYMVQTAPCGLQLAKEYQNGDQFSHFIQRTPFPAVDCKPTEAVSTGNPIGAEVRGKVDGAFDSGLLMTATVNGKIYRGVLFAPATGFTSRRALMAKNPSPPGTQLAAAQPFPNSIHLESSKPSQQATTVRTVESSQSLPTQPNGPYPGAKTAPILAKDSKLRSDLQGLVLSLGRSSNGHVG